MLNGRRRPTSDDGFSGIKNIPIKDKSIALRPLGNIYHSNETQYFPPISRLKELTSENILLNEEIEQLTAQISRLHLIKPSHSEMKRTIRIIEEQVERDRQNFQHQVKVLQSKNQQLLTQVGPNGTRRV